MAFDLAVDDSKAVWLKIKHPFFIANSPDPEGTILVSRWRWWFIRSPSY